MLDNPLLNPDSPAPFTRRISGKPTPGKVYSQFKDQHHKEINHPSAFYVEFPEGIFNEISSRRLAAVIGDGATARSFHRIEIARTLERIDQKLDLEKLLPKIAPPNT
jgi:hypothetical protein